MGEDKQNFRFLPLSVRLGTLGGLATQLVPRGTPLPTERVQVFSTAEDNQERVSIDVYMGERPLVHGTTALGSIELAGIPPALHGEPKLRVRFSVDHHCVVRVEARIDGTEVEASDALHPPADLVSSSGVKQHLKEAEAAREADEH